jgi:hypothetical protein
VSTSTHAPRAAMTGVPRSRLIGSSSLGWFVPEMLLFGANELLSFLGPSSFPGASVVPYLQQGEAQ